MSQSILTECAMFINHHIILQERLQEYHQKAYSSLDRLLTANLKGYPAPILHLYVWEIRDIIGQATKLNQSMLDTMQSILKFVEASRKPTSGNNGNSNTVH